MSIKQTKSGTWQVELESTKNGKRRRWDKTFKTRAEAVAYQTKIRQQINTVRASRLGVLDLDLTLKQAWEDFCIERETRLRHASPHRAEHHRRYMLKGIAAVARFAPGLRLAHITIPDVLDYIDERRADEKSESTIRNELQGLSTMCKALATRGIALDNPFRIALGTVGTSRSRVERLEQSEFDTINQALEDLQTQARKRLLVNGHIVPTPGDPGYLPGGLLSIDGPHETISVRASLDITQIHTAFIAALETTLRASALFSIDWSQIRMQSGTQYFAMGASAANKNVPKALPISPRLAEVLMSAKSWRVKPELFAGLNGQKARRVLQDVCKAHGIRPLTWHILRHEGISRLADAGWSPSQMQAVSGHKTLQMLSRYTHPDISQISQLMQQLPQR